MLSKIKSKLSSCTICSKMKSCPISLCILSCLKISLISIISIGLLTFAFKSYIIEKMLLSNPKAIIKAVEKMRETEGRKAQENAEKKAPEVFNKISTNGLIPFIGNENAKNIVEVFYDYNCGYCKKQSMELLNLVQVRKDTKIILVDFPVLSRESFMASVVGSYIYLNHKDSFKEYHKILMESKQVTADVIKNTLKTLKLSANIIEKAQKDSSVMAILKQNHEFATSLNIQGTPALLINGQFIPGYAPIDHVSSMLK